MIAEIRECEGPPVFSPANHGRHVKVVVLGVNGESTFRGCPSDRQLPWLHTGT